MTLPRKSSTEWIANDVNAHWWPSFSEAVQEADRLGVPRAILCLGGWRVIDRDAFNGLRARMLER